MPGGGLPQELLRAISSPGGGKVALVVGAGCSAEAPTGIPMARECSVEVHRRLVADGILQDRDCADPSDLSLVADAVFDKTGSQKELVERLCERYELKLASANEGYLIAAAMLCEGAISSVVTLNFDLALSDAIAQLGAAQVVGLIECPEDMPRKQKAINVYYLHRNANELDPDLWVLRNAALQNEWRGHWQPIIATRVLTAPVVVFAGLGNPAAVLIETMKLVQHALPTATSFYQVDLADRGESRSFRELGLDPSSYIKRGWGQFMDDLSQRLLAEQVSGLQQAVLRKIEEDRLPSENVHGLLVRLQILGLLKLGKLRAHWLLHDKAYCPARQHPCGLVADLLLAVAMMARVSGAAAVIADDGLVEFERDGRIVVAFLVASGGGHRGRSAVEAEVESRRRQFRSRRSLPRGVLVGGTSDSWTTLVTPPEDVVRGDAIEGDIVSGSTALLLLHISELRSDSRRIHELVP